MKIIEAIKKALKAKKIDEKYAERVQKTFKVEKEEDVDAAVDSFKDNVLPAIAEAEEEARKATKEEFEKKSKEEKEKAEKEAKEKEEKEKAGKEKGDKENPDKEKEKGKELDPAIKAIIDNYNTQIEEMKELILTSQKNAENAEKAAEARNLIKNAHLPEKWIDRIKLDSDVKLEDQVKALEEEYAEITQKTIDEKVASGEYLPGAFEVKDRSEEDWLKIMDGDETGTASGVAPLE